MTHLKLFALKFVATLIVLGIILSAGFDVSFQSVFYITLVLTVVAYLVGDLLILSKTNNSVATFADFILAFAVIYFMTDALTVGDDVLMATAISTVSLVIFEYFFHQSVARSLDHEKKTNSAVNERTHVSNQFQTETSTELYPTDTDKK
ncbi:YndM family protein [Jeotgalibacillus sp. R-1-5s-1]|uniref:YndM family protein n=1 Tax=Jeotgalibacillus sp. R-1-5s-1 TaxID=2555897 RepID=UPI00106C83AF|nr:YndM family protein [Jeotgalibacillus sp. R-1-5s-1]TFD93642.1 DUF2512 family protein [Jeotgalibacillus sp. R-1-5s-1]